MRETTVSFVRHTVTRYFISYFKKRQLVEITARKFLQHHNTRKGIVVHSRSIRCELMLHFTVVLSYYSISSLRDESNGAVHCGYLAQMLCNLRME